MPDRPQRLLPLRLLGRSPRPEQGTPAPSTRSTEAQAGIYQISIPEWDFPGMPHPLGRLTDRPDDQGRVWVTTPHIKQLERLHRDGHLTTPVTIQDSWTGKANESLFKPFYAEARTELIQAGSEPYKNYKTRLSIALRPALAQCLQGRPEGACSPGRVMRRSPDC
ncbi:hypothetical protein [Streptomyces kaempferi]|uniref:Uncharacterized protein n=1 Tax=Streptomyces kaempferi TaxID=333725 RepID=A0ABW3XWE6_9ACTN